jgi:hypothetical protein
MEDLDRLQLRLSNEARCESNIRLEQRLYGAGIILNNLL